MLLVVKLLLVRTPHIGDPIFDALTVCRSTTHNSVTWQSRSTLDRQLLIWRLVKPMVQLLVMVQLL